MQEMIFELCAETIEAVSQQEMAELTESNSALDSVRVESPPAAG